MGFFGKLKNITKSVVVISNTIKESRPICELASGLRRASGPDKLASSLAGQRDRLSQYCRISANILRSKLMHDEYVLQGVEQRHDAAVQSIVVYWAFAMGYDNIPFDEKTLESQSNSLYQILDRDKRAYVEQWVPKFNKMAQLLANFLMNAANADGFAIPGHAGTLFMSSDIPQGKITLLGSKSQYQIERPFLSLFLLSSKLAGWNGANDLFLTDNGLIMLKAVGEGTSLRAEDAGSLVNTMKQVLAAATSKNDLASKEMANFLEFCKTGSFKVVIESGEDRYLRELTALVPDWRGIANDPGYAAYLQEIDTKTGEKRYAAAKSALDELDAGKMSKFYFAYKREKGLDGSFVFPAPKEIRQDHNYNEDAWKDVWQKAKNSRYGLYNTAVDIPLAHKLFLEAKDLGCPMAFRCIGDLYYYGKHVAGNQVAESESTALAYYREGILAGDYYCCIDISRLFWSNGLKDAFDRSMSSLFQYREHKVNSVVENEDEFAREMSEVIAWCFGRKTEPLQSWTSHLSKEKEGIVRNAKSMIEFYVKKGDLKNIEDRKNALAWIENNL